MSTGPQGFQRRVKDRVKKERKTIEFFISSTDEDEDGVEYEVSRDVYHATTPTEEQLFLIFASGGREDASIGDESAAVLGFFRDALPDGEYRRLVKRLRDPDDLDIDAQLLAEIFQWLMEQFQDFPTTPPSGSSGSQASSGARSTGRARGKGSTR